jgi:hypothetical protein
VFTLQYQKQLSNCLKRAETSVVFIIFYGVLSSVKSGLILLSLLNVNQVPENIYLGQ